jgi:hypothetical protein
LSKHVRVKAELRILKKGTRKAPQTKKPHIKCGFSMKFFLKILRRLVPGRPQTGKGSLQGGFGPGLIKGLRVTLRLGKSFLGPLLGAHGPIDINLPPELGGFDQKGDLVVGNLTKTAADHHLLFIAAFLVSHYPNLDRTQERRVIRQNAELTAVTGSGNDIDILTQNGSTGSYNFKFYGLSHQSASSLDIYAVRHLKARRRTIPYSVSDYRIRPLFL